MKKGNSSIHLITIVSLGLSLVVVSAGFKTVAEKQSIDDWIRTKKQTALPCGTNEWMGGKKKALAPSEKGDPANRDSRDGCSHLWSPGALSGISGSKRRDMKHLSC